MLGREGKSGYTYIDSYIITFTTTEPTRKTDTNSRYRLFALGSPHFILCIQTNSGKFMVG